MKILFVQFANSVYKRHSSCDAYWDAFYNRWENIGYYKGNNSFEIPKWIAEINYFTPGIEKELFWCHHDVSEVTNKIQDSLVDYVLFSLMNANQDYICSIVCKCPQQKFIIGGYNDVYLKKLRREFQNVTICDTTENVSRILGREYFFGTNYSLFKGEKTIPRLTMSYGCLNNCKFCIVPHGKVKSVDEGLIKQQIKSFNELNYKLIYIDDKTFGQSANYRTIKSLNPVSSDFNGFIVQTTSGMLIKKAEEFKSIGVYVAEYGLETYNDSILKKYRKPSSERFSDIAIETCNDVGLKLIANVIIGLPEETEETYQRTFDYVMNNLSNGKPIGMNPAIYTDYNNNENLGEIDFMEDRKTELHRKWWDKFNTTATEILIKQKYNVEE